MVFLNPAARVLWRSDDCVQLELGARAIVVDGVGPNLIGALTGGGPVESAALAQLSDQATETAGPRAHAADRLVRAAGLESTLTALEAGGFVVRRRGPATPPAHPGLAGELAALSARHGSRAEHVLAQRSTATVVVHGTGRLAVGLGALLAAANIGRVSMHDSGVVHRHDTAPGGLLAADEGRRFNEAAHDALRRAAPGVDTRGTGPAERADLVVLTGDVPVAAEVRQWLHERAIAHLAVRAGADEAVVGPLVLPGLSSCLACADRTRLDRDPAWSLLAVQLCTPRRHADPSDLALTSLAASLAAVHALAFLDGEEPAALSSTLELRLPDWQLRRRSWPPHPGCDCGAIGTATRTWAQ